MSFDYCEMCKSKEYVKTTREATKRKVEKVFPKELVALTYLQSKSAEKAVCVILRPA